MSDTPGYGAEPNDVRAVLDALVGPRDAGDSDDAWYAHLTSRQALFTAAVDQLGQQRAALVACMHAEPGQSYATIAERTGLSRARVQKMVERGTHAELDRLVDLRDTKE